MCDNGKEALGEIVLSCRAGFHNSCPWLVHGERCETCPLGCAGANCIFSKIADKVEVALDND